MKRAHCLIGRAYSKLSAYTVVAVILGMACLPASRPAWSQSTWPSYPNNTAISVTAAGNVGIGTTSPAGRLQVTSSGNPVPMVVGDAGCGSGFMGLTFGQPVGCGNYTLLSNGPHTWLNAPGGNIQFVTGNAGRMTVSYNGNVGIGTGNPQYLLSVNGQIGAKDVIVTNSGWSDYVFEPGYRLRPLSELSVYIHAHHHLPDIPSEAEVKEKGVSMAEMQTKLLAKIEELTLHMIQQDKDNRGLRELMAQQEKQNQELRDRISQLEAHAAGAPSAPPAAATAR